MNAIFIEAKKQLRDRRAGLLRLAGNEAVGATAIVSQAANEVEQIDAALARIESGTYGECVRCGHAIGRQRLRAIPEARLCISCSAR